MGKHDDQSVNELLYKLYDSSEACSTFLTNTFKPGYYDCALVNKQQVVEYSFFQ